MNKAYQLELLLRLLTSQELTSGLYLLDTDLDDEEIEDFISQTGCCSYVRESLLQARGGSALEMFVIGLSHQCNDRAISEQRDMLLRAGDNSRDKILYSLLILMLRQLCVGGRTIVHLRGEYDMSILPHEEVSMLHEALSHHREVVVIASKNKNSKVVNNDPLIKKIILRNTNKYRLMESRLEKVHISYKHSDAYDKVLKAIIAGLKGNNIPYSIDKYDIMYGDNIDNYEKEIGAADRVIMIVIPEYLKSLDCMFEMTEMFKNGRIKERVYPLVDFGEDITRNGDGLTVIKDYWQQEKSRKSQRMMTEPGGSSYLMMEIQKIDDILKTLNDLWFFICRDSTGDFEELTKNDAAMLIDIIKNTLPKVEAEIVEKFVPSTGAVPPVSRTVIQNGAKSVSIENNTGTVIIN